MAPPPVLRHRSPLGQWSFAVSDPEPPLAGIVNAIWYVEGDVSYQRDRMLPLGEVEVVINLGPAKGLVDETNPLRNLPLTEAWVAGPRLGHLVTESSGPCHLYGFRLHAAGASRVLGLAMHELAGRVIPLDLVLGGGVRELRERMMEAPTTAARFRLLEEWLETRVRSGLETPGEVRWAVGRLERTQGRSSIGRIEASLGVSPKRLISLFHDHIGLPPKKIGRVYRFRGVLETLRRSERVDWATLALSAGYADQSHLVREFRSFSGGPPGDYLRRRITDCKSVVVA